MTKINLGKEKFYSLHFQVIVHHWEMSGQTLEQEL